MIKFAVLGCGVASNFHAKAISEIENARLYAVCDLSEESANAFAEKYGCKAFCDYDKMLLDENIDVICICTPSAFHAEGAIKALKGGKHVIVEKPMALNVDDCNAVIKAAKESGKQISVISQLRYSDNVQYVKKCIADGSFGKILSADLYMKYWRDAEYFAKSNWRGTFKFDGGGALMNQGIHGIDMLYYLVGNMKILFGKTKTIYHNIEVEDMAHAVVEFENGAMGVIEGTTCLAPGFARRIEIIGTNGYVFLNEDNVDKMVIGGEDVTHLCKEGTMSRTFSNGPEVPHHLHKRQLENFLAALDGSEELIITPEDGKKAIEIISSIYNFSK